MGQNLKCIFSNVLASLGLLVELNSTDEEKIFCLYLVSPFMAHFQVSCDEVVVGIPDNMTFRKFCRHDDRKVA